MNYLESLFSLEGRTALVTGAAKGNGKAMAEALLKSGAEVILVDILDNELQKTVKLFKSKGLKADSYSCDLTNLDAIKALVKYAQKSYAQIDILINCAGITYSHSLFDYPDELWQKTYETNLKAPFELSKRVGGIMKTNKSGVIINITSINAEIAFPDNPAYVTFKGALKQLSKSLALDLGKYGIRVNCIGPGYFKTDMTKKSWENRSLREKRKKKTVLGRWGYPSDLSGIAVFLSSDASSYITGQDIYVDGGWLIKGE